MENFIVSARKYRPATFDTVVGQKTLTTTLRNAIKNKQLAHAYLFCGPRGVGKTTCARIFAKTINCNHLTPEIEACDVCESCVSFNGARSYNIHELDAASNNSVEDIRSLIDQVRIPPQIGTHSVYIIDEVHMLSSQAFNAFLKTLEEPPKHATFILATTEKHKILPTILSRCQIFDFNRIKVEDIADHLANVARKENIEYDLDGLNVIAQKADGGMRDALSFFDQISSFSGNKITYENVIQNLNVLDYEFYFQLTDAFLNNNIADSLLLYNQILNKGFDSHNFIAGMAEHFRDLLVCKDPATLELLEVGATIRENYKKQSSICPTNFLFRALSIANDCDLNYKNAKNKRLLVELTILKLCHITNQQQAQQPQIVQQVVQQVVQTPTAQPVAPQVQTSKTISLKDLIASKTVVPQNTTPQNEHIQTVTNEDKDFTQEQLTEKWKQYSEKIKFSNPRLYSTFLSHLPILRDNFIFEIILINESQRESMIEQQKEIILFLRKELINNKIDMKISVVPAAAPAEKKVMTESEKINFLIEKNPLVKKLLDDFKLTT